MRANEEWTSLSAVFCEVRMYFGDTCKLAPTCFRNAFLDGLNELLALIGEVGGNEDYH